MKNPSHDERNTKTFAFIIIVALIMSILMRGVNSRMYVPHVLYVAIAVLCGVMSVVSYIGFIYCKMFKTVASRILTDMIKIILLGVMTYFMITFAITVINNI